MNINSIITQSLTVISLISTLLPQTPLTLQYTEQIKWHTHISNYGGQAAVDECLGGLTDFTAVSQWLGRPYWPIHLHCGGKPILQIAVGDRISVAEHGVFEAVQLRDVVPGGAGQIRDMIGDVFVQTCHDHTATSMRVVSLVRS